VEAKELIGVCGPDDSTCFRAELSQDFG